MTPEQIKAQIYDLIVLRENAATKITQLNQQLIETAKKNEVETPKEEKKEEVKK